MSTGRAFTRSAFVMICTYDIMDVLICSQCLYHCVLAQVAPFKLLPFLYSTSLGSHCKYWRNVEYWPLLQSSRSKIVSNCIPVYVHDTSVFQQRLCPTLILWSDRKNSYHSYFARTTTYQHQVHNSQTSFSQPWLFNHAIACVLCQPSTFPYCTYKPSKRTSHSS